MFNLKQTISARASRAWKIPKNHFLHIDKIFCFSGLLRLLLLLPFCVKVNDQLACTYLC